MANQKNILVQLLTKAPVEGWAKSRMAESLGTETAKDLQVALLAKVLQQIKNLGLPFRIWMATPFEEDPHAFLDADLHPYTKSATQESLGKNLRDAAGWAWKQGFDASLFLGVDCPVPLEEHLGQAVETLEKEDAVLGPAEDGGVYLLGMDQIDEGFWAEIPWGTERVFEALKIELQKRGQNAIDLPPGWDVDRKEDLLRLREEWKTKKDPLGTFLQTLQA